MTLIAALAILAVVILGLTGYRFLRLWIAPGSVARNASVCGKCGYNVAGLPSFICPECGSDLREVGINRPAGTRRDGRPRFRDLPKPIRRQIMIRLAWATAVFICVEAGIAWVFLSGSATVHGIEVRQDRFSPQSGAFTQLTLRTEFPTIYTASTMLREQPTKMDVEIEVQPNAGTSKRISVELPGRMASYVPLGSTGNVPVHVVLDVDFLKHWMHDQAGVDVSKPDVAAEVEEIVSIFKFYETSPPGTGTEWQEKVSTLLSHYRFSGYTGSGNFSGGGGGPMLANVAATLAYIAAGIWIARGGHRAKAALAKSASSPQEIPPRSAQSLRESRASRTLSILFTDIEGFTALAATSSRDRLVELLRLNRAMVESAVTQRGGRVIKSVGDAVLSTFESATDAVHAGLELQAAITRRAQSADLTDQFRLRIGLSTGEVTTEAEDVYGTAVNVASRVQSITEPGQVWFTEAAYHAMNIAEVPHELVGEFELKGVPARVKIYRALMPALADGTTKVS